MKEYGTLIEILEERRLTKTALAGILGIERTYLSGILHGRLPGYAVKKKINEVFGRVIYPEEHFFYVRSKAFRKMRTSKEKGLGNEKTGF